MTKKVAILGSSGGNLYNLGGKDPASLLGEMVRQIKGAGMELTAIQFIGAEASMDTAKPDTKAALWTWNGEEPKVVFRGTLEEVNREAGKVYHIFRQYEARLSWRKERLL